MTVSLLDGAFVAVMASTLSVRLLLPARLHHAVGLAASAALIGVASPLTLVVIAGLCIVYLFPLSVLIRSAAERPNGRTSSRALLIAGACGLVAILVAVKAQRFFALPFRTGTDHPWIAIAGLSYFIFKAINVLYIHYLTPVKGSSAGSILSYALFPPTLTSGPIQKYADFAAQLMSPRALTLRDLGDGTYRITRGYFRKLVLAYVLDLVAADLLKLAAPAAHQSFLLLVCLYLFFYFDFAGYSDIAVGFGLLMGIRVPENFRRPFLATSITEFWRNWHITLADWFRDHVFIPAGGLRLGGIRASALSLFIMVLCGLWHGFTWMFIGWGAWHGTLLLLEGITGSRPMPPASRHGPRYWGRIVWTNARVAVGTLFFLPSTEVASRVLGGFLRW